MAHRSEPGHAELDPHMVELGPEPLKVKVAGVPFDLQRPIPRLAWLLEHQLLDTRLQESSDLWPFTRAFPRSKEYAGLGHRKQFSENVRITCVLAEQCPTNVLCRTIQGGGGRNPRNTISCDYLQDYISCLLLRIMVKIRRWVECLYESIQIWGLPRISATIWLFRHLIAASIHAHLWLILHESSSHSIG